MESLYLLDQTLPAPDGNFSLLQDLKILLEKDDAYWIIMDFIYSLCKNDMLENHPKWPTLEEFLPWLQEWLDDGTIYISKTPLGNKRFILA